MNVWLRDAICIVRKEVLTVIKCEVPLRISQTVQRMNIEFAFSSLPVRPPPASYAVHLLQLVILRAL